MKSVPQGTYDAIILDVFINMGMYFLPFPSFSLHIHSTIIYIHMHTYIRACVEHIQYDAGHAAEKLYDTDLLESVRKALRMSTPAESLWDNSFDIAETISNVRKHSKALSNTLGPQFLHIQSIILFLQIKFYLCFNFLSIMMLMLFIFTDQLECFQWDDWIHALLNRGSNIGLQTPCERIESTEFCCRRRTNQVLQLRSMNLFWVNGFFSQLVQSLLFFLKIHTAALCLPSFTKKAIGLKSLWRIQKQSIRATDYWKITNIILSSINFFQFLVIVAVKYGFTWGFLIWTWTFSTKTVIDTLLGFTMSLFNYNHIKPCTDFSELKSFIQWWFFLKFKGLLSFADLWTRDS